VDALQDELSGASQYLERSQSRSELER
jgi:hypothetical protein